MENGNTISEKETQYDIDTYPLFRERLMQLITENGYTKQSFSTAIGIGVRTLYNWRKGISRKYPCNREYVIPDLSTLEKIANLFNVSIDYLLGRSAYTSVSNELIGNELRLSDKAINGIRKINNNTDRKIDMYGCAYSNGYNLTLNGTSNGTLDFLLSNDTFTWFMDNFLDYSFPTFTVPVSYDEKSGNYVAPKKNECTYSDNLKLWYLNVASSENNPNDIMPVLLDKDFFERVAMDKIVENLKSLKRDLCNQRNSYMQMLKEMVNEINKNDKTTP